MNLFKNWKQFGPRPISGRGLLLLLLLVVFVGIPCLWGAAKIIKTKHSTSWLPQFTSDLVQGRYRGTAEPRHMIFLMCDHWEPGGGEKGLSKSVAWLDNFEQVADMHNDSQGRRFQYSWFYPIDNFSAPILERLSTSVSRGYGEIEVHWHHRHSDPDTFETDLQNALADFSKVGALVSNPGDRPRFAFIHGNWTLDNSGAPRHCGIDNEIDILLRNGCYGDFTFPALGTSAQPKTINRIFYTEDTPGPKSYDLNPQLAEVGSSGSGLMMVPGPLALDFRNPKILFEYGALDDAEGSGMTRFLGSPSSGRDYFKSHRVELWNNLGIGVQGRPEWVFVKIHAHGIPHRNIFFDGELDEMLKQVESFCLEKNIKLHYVVAREAYNLVKAAESGAIGPPEDFYDYEIPPPLNRQNSP